MLKIESEFTPKGDQPTAIKQLMEGLEDGYRFQTLLGATGTGKTYTVAQIIRLPSLACSEGGAAQALARSGVFDKT